MRFSPRIIVSLALLGIGVTPAANAQTNLVQNPSFATVSTQTVNGITGIPDVPTSWTQTGSSGCAFQALETNQTTSQGGDFTIGAGGASNPTGGAQRVLISDQNPANASCQIYQDVALPTGGAPSLTLDAGAGFSVPLNSGSSFSVAVYAAPTGAPPANGTLIATIFSQTDSAGNIALATQSAVDLSAYAGQTVRIIGSASQLSSDWAGLQMDNVNLISAPTVPVPTLSGWSLIAFGLLVGGTGWAIA